MVLEEGRWADIPGEVYARGFFRAYADFLGLDGLGLLRTLGEPPRAGPEGEGEREAKRTREDRVSGKGKARVVFGLLLLVLGAGVLLASLYYWPSRPGSRVPGPGAEPAPGELGGPPAGEPALPREAPETQEAASPSPGAGSPSPETQETAPGASPDTSPLPPVRREDNRFFFVLPPGEFTLSGEFSAPCWLRVEADGKRVFEGTIPAGGRGEWKAGRRLTVRVGNPPAASFRVGGRNLSLPAERRPVNLEIAAE